MQIITKKIYIIFFLFFFIHNSFANEILKKILNIGQNLNGFILILDLLNLSFRKAKINKKKNCKCK